MAPTILRIDGLRATIYPNDHPPAHVHVIEPGWVVINLLELEVREVVGCDKREAGRTLRLIVKHQAALMEAWRRLHG